MIRNAQESDAAAIAAIHVRGWQVAYAGIVPAVFLDSLAIDQRTTYWQKLLRPGRSGTLVFCAQDLVIGWIDHGRASDTDRTGEAEVYAIYIAPGHWGNGAGTKLLQHAELAIFSRGIPRVSLWVLEQNAPARRFYERRGFTDDGTRKPIDIGGVSLVEMRYEKRNAHAGDCVR